MVFQKFSELTEEDQQLYNSFEWHKGKNSI
jgi:hypothetical protein